MSWTAGEPLKNRRRLVRRGDVRADTAIGYMYKSSLVACFRGAAQYPHVYAYLRSTEAPSLWFTMRAAAD